MALPSLRARLRLAVGVAKQIRSDQGAAFDLMRGAGVVAPELAKLGQQRERSSLLFMSNPLFRHNFCEFSFNVSDVAIPFFKHKVTSGACGGARFGPVIKDGLIPILVRGPKNSVLLHPSD